MGYEVSVIQEFAAAHRLENYEGNCSNVHGHTWKVEVVISGEELDETGMLVDFRELKKCLSTLISQKYDHTFLNEVSPFDRINPTAENIAREIFGEVEKRLEGIKVEMVRVWESPTAYAAYKGV